MVSILSLTKGLSFSHREHRKKRTHSHKKPHPQPLSEWRGE